MAACHLGKWGICRWPGARREHARLRPATHAMKACCCHALQRLRGTRLHGTLSWYQNDAHKSFGDAIVYFSGTKQHRRDAKKPPLCSSDIIIGRSAWKKSRARSHVVEKIQLAREHTHKVTKLQEFDMVLCMLSGRQQCLGLGSNSSTLLFACGGSTPFLNSLRPNARQWRCGTKSHV